jgi:hypothetical protein
VERFFMGVALVRVLFAHSLLTAPRLALGHLGAAGRVLGDPADAGPTRSDYGVILPRVRPVYAQAGRPGRAAAAGPAPGRLARLRLAL